MMLTVCLVVVMTSLVAGEYGDESDREYFWGERNEYRNSDRDWNGDWYRNYYRNGDYMRNGDWNRENYMNGEWNRDYNNGEWNRDYYMNRDWNSDYYRNGYWNDGYNRNGGYYRNGEYRNWEAFRQGKECWNFFDDMECKQRADNDECMNNREFMMDNCRMMCQFC